MKNIQNPITNIAKNHGSKICFLIPSLPLSAYFCRMASELKLGDALKQFVSKSTLKNGLRAVQIEEIWEQVMGKTIAKYTDKIQIVNHTLFIQTAVGPLKQELLYQKPQIIARINEALKENVIKEVVIQ